MSDAAERIVQSAVEISGLQDYAGSFHELGGGEVNETFLLNGAAQNYILRVTKVPGRDTLLKEAKALALLDLPGVPREVFFSPEQRVDNRYWILETQVEGSSIERLSVPQFRSLGGLLAKVHATKDPEGATLDLWAQFLRTCRYFGSEESLLAHPHGQLRTFTHALYDRIQEVQPVFSKVETRLIHGDATPSNILVQEDSVALIDWEFASFSDPMREFSTIYYDDMEYNRGKWRAHISAAEKQALFEGYGDNGGEFAEERIDFWMNFDKLGAATYLYWKLHESGQDVDAADRQQNEHDLEQLLKSLEQYSDKEVE